MKHLFIILFALLNASIAWADIEINEKNFPDPLFRSYLRNVYAKDGLLTDEIIAGVKRIYLPAPNNVQSLKGIEYLTALEELYCERSMLTELDISKNTKLTRLYCSENQITKLDVSKNTELKELYCDINMLTELDVSMCTKLEELYCDYNQLTEIDVSKNPELKILYCSNNPLTGLDLSKNPELSDLYCSEDQLAELDLSKNPKLRLLYCPGNQLTELDLSENIQLRYLECPKNQLTELDLSKNTELWSLYCSGNQLTELNLSKNTTLYYFMFYNNEIKGKGMDVLVESLPIVNNGKLIAIINNDKHNVMTKAQVAAAKEKGWTPYEITDDGSRESYEGSDNTDGIDNVITTPPGSDPTIYNLSGQRLNKMQKGINIINGKKIIAY